MPPSPRIRLVLARHLHRAEGPVICLAAGKGAAAMAGRRSGTISTNWDAAIAAYRHRHHSPRHGVPTRQIG